MRRTLFVLHFLAFFGLGFEGEGRAETLLDVESTLQIVVERQQPRGVGGTRQKREMDEKQMGLELVDMGRRAGGNWTIERREEEEGREEEQDLLLLMRRNEWIWLETGELGGNGTGLGMADWPNGTNPLAQSSQNSSSSRSSTTPTNASSTSTTSTPALPPRRRIRKKEPKFAVKRPKTKQTSAWPFAWLDWPTSQSPQSTPTLPSSSTTTLVPSSTPKTAQSTLSTPAPRICCPVGGVWGKWTAAGQCSDNCGACGTQMFRRECISSAWGCACIGESAASRECALVPCPFPRLACCNGLKVQSNGQRLGRQAICGGQQPDPPANLPLPGCLCCPTGGVWGEWKAEEECSDSCGSCGTRQYTRECISAGWGCACSGPVKLRLVCNQQPCTFPRLSCCNGMRLKGGSNRTLICGAEAKLPESQNPVTCV